MTVAIFGDAQAEAAAVLRAALADRTEPYAAGVTIGGRVPTGRTIDVPMPYVLVRCDGTPETVYPIVARATVRVTAWHHDDDQAFDLAQLCHGLLCAHTGAVIAGCAPLTGPIRGTDPDSGTDLATFTVRANVTGRLI